jgi:epoxide hydrolase-like predicted phosphatase
LAIDAVLWDYGGVFSASPFEAMGRLAESVGVAPDRYVGLIFGPYDRDDDHPWHRLERGEISLGDARDQILELGRAEGVEADLLHFIAAMAKEGIGVRDEVVALAREIKSSGTRTALVTNNIAEFREHWRNSIPIDELFHHVVDSSEVGLRKPDPRIFELALEKVGASDPGRAVFLDDYEGNVEAARRVGIHGILVTSDFGEALDELCALLAAS